mgnify:CR=1 FL=1
MLHAEGELDKTDPQHIHIHKRNIGAKNEVANITNGTTPKCVKLFTTENSTCRVRFVK